MDSGVYNSAIRMATDGALNMEVCSENLANANMPGYKRLDVMNSSFETVLEEKKTPQSGSMVKVNHLQGALRETGRKLDLAIEGDGFFELSDGEKKYYTRNGHFRVGADGSIVNSAGLVLQRTSGDIFLPPGSSAEQITLDEELNLRAGKRDFGQLKIVAFNQKGLLKKAGNSVFVAGNDSKLAEVDPNCHVLSGYLEQSNTSIFEEMVNMMTTLRNYEACQKIIRSVDEVEGKMMSKLA